MDEARHLATLPTEYPQLGCTCLGCQHVQKASYPEGVNAPIQYGARIEAYAAYLSVYQYLPYQRLALLFKDVFKLPLSQGSLYNLLERPETIIGSDRWAAQLKTTSRAKQLCLAHLQRDLIFLEESELSPWATHCKILLQDALQAGKLAQQRGGAFAPQEAIVCRLEHRLNRLLTRTIDQEQFAQTLTFQRSMIRHRDSHAQSLIRLKNVIWMFLLIYSKSWLVRLPE